ncbi:hypothetical protein GC093_11590 [Paenibacillus sp. LMG 31456]|uniref:DUF1453 domain-containing protein n=1 Tax=Paenibacillus foliorum TaxID=2654974 RepID=A0A972K1G1_9BACL|nr:hypothetical protein [Paenibacillus foliorum]NOU93863.1 hypothetical protein [Paenibacillus foliorum]
MDVRHIAITAGFTVLIAFMLYRRFKRSVGFQKLTRSRLIFRSVLFGVLGCVFLYLGMMHPINFVADAVGMAGGLLLSYYAVKHLRFEKRQDGWYYCTHIGIEVTVLVLFMSRIGYRLIGVYLQDPAAQAAAANSMQDFTKDPLTVGIFFVLIAYYLRYFIHLLRKEKQLDLDTKSA